MALTKWTPTTNLMMLRRMGKLQEELGELSVVASRCIIQGIDEIDPGSGRVNRDRLHDELADVIAQCFVTILLLELDVTYIDERVYKKVGQMKEWEAMFKGEE
jgi:NTP pyrophosphatase (non-canonical NTP hydrolase)